MRQAVGAAVVALVSMLTPAEAEELSLSGSEALGCSAVSGEFVGFLVPGGGIVLLATQEFPGSSPAGAVQEGRLVARIRGLDPIEFVSDSTAGVAVWGMLDRSLEIVDELGCFAFGSFRWSDVDDLKTYLHWIVREGLTEIPWDAAAGDEPPVLALAERLVTLEIQTPDHRILHLQGVEGATLGYRPRDAETTFFFQPFVIGPGEDRAGVRVSTKEGAFFGPGATREVDFVLVHTDEPTTLRTSPPLTLRLVAVSDPAETVPPP